MELCRFSLYITYIFIFLFVFQLAIQFSVETIMWDALVCLWWLFLIYCRKLLNNSIIHWLSVILNTLRQERQMLPSLSAKMKVTLWYERYDLLFTLPALRKSVGGILFIDRKASDFQIIFLEEYNGTVYQQPRFPNSEDQN